MLIKQIIFLSFLLLPFLPLPLQAQENKADAEYRQLVELSQTMPADFDFGKVRSLYVHTSFFSPYGVDPKMDFSPFFKRQDAGDVSVVKDVDAYVAKNFALPEAHSRAMSMYKTIGNAQKSAYHEWAVRGLIKAMWASGDTASPETAMHVVTISEEYLVLRQRGERGGQRVQNVNGRVYDVLTVKPKDGSAPYDMWFDVTQIFSKGLD